MMVMKGLPLAYSKDMQEDKEQTFDALNTLSLMVAAMTGMIGDMEVNAPGCARRRREAIRPRPTLPIGWSASWACHSVTRIMSQARSSNSPKASDVGLEALSPWRTCRAPSRESTDAVFSGAQRGKFRGQPPQLWGHSARKCG